MLKKADRIKLTRLVRNNQFVKDAFNTRRPATGDVATVMDVFTGPVEGYELECVDHRGDTVWRLGFAADEIEYELV